MENKLKRFSVTLTLDGGATKKWIIVKAVSKEDAIRKAKQRLLILDCTEHEE